MYTLPTEGVYPGSVTYSPADRNYGGTTGSNFSNGENDKYITTTKIMVLALAVLFAVVFFVICFHLYAKWVWSTSTPARAPGLFSFWTRRWRRRSNRASEVILDGNVFDMNLVAGLGKAAVEAIPTFRYKKGFKSAGALECAICLGQFQEDELGRTLPKCGHDFHQECIDMWLYSHSTCPLCRAVLAHGEHDSIALTLEQSHVPVLRPERMSTPRRPPDDHTILPQPDEPATGDESEQHAEQETGNKNADSIPANILFWGNLLQQVGANSRVVHNIPQQAGAQIAIDIVDIDIGSTTARDRHAQDTSPTSPATASL